MFECLLWIVNWLCVIGVVCGDCILLMLLNWVELWDVMLVVMKFGVIVLFVIM